MRQRQPSPVWASTSVGPLFAGPMRAGTVLASSELASYVTVPPRGTGLTLFALLNPGAVRVPVGVCVHDRQLPAQGASVSIGDGLATSGELTWRPVRWWDPRPRVAADALLRNDGRVLLDIVLAEPTSSFGVPLPEALAVAGALAEGNAEPALGVIGLGPGLTPAGDDVVAGALAVLALAGRLDDSVRDAIHAHASTRTVALSAALLEAAGRGQMIPQAARLLTIVAAGDPHDLAPSAASELFRVGSTSGHDLCAGMAGALEALS